MKAWYKKKENIILGLVVLSFCILAGLGMPDILEAIQKSKRSSTAADMRVLGEAIGNYNVDNGHFPIYSGHLINDFFSVEYAHFSVKDGWGTSFQYISLDGKGYTLISCGKDKKIGGNGEFESDIIYITGQFVAPRFLVAPE